MHPEHSHEQDLAPLPQLATTVRLTWVGTLPALLAVHESGNSKGRSQAREDLRRMADLADLAFSAVTTLERVVADGHARKDDVQEVFAEARRLANVHPAECSLVEPGAGATKVTADQPAQHGVLAKFQGGVDLPLEVCYGARGWYIGTYQDNKPFTCESEDHWQRRADALNALRSGDWTQRSAL